jgi:hypothetical protein
MSTARAIAGMWFWMWIGLAFVLGLAVGVVVGAGGLIVLQALIDYVPPG